MSELKLARSMERPLTPDEEAIVINFFKANENMDLAEMRVKLSDQLKLQITEHCLYKLMLKESMK